MLWAMRKVIKYLSIILGSLFVSGFLLLFFSPKPSLLEEFNFSKAVYDDNQQLLRLILSEDDKYRLYVPLSQIPKELMEATLLQEDQYFPWHKGVNPFSMVKAIWQTYVVKSRRIGASTITMQVARIRFGINSKKISGKLWQIIRALQIERHYDKDKILEAYFNLAPYGGNIEGVGAASLIYFNKPVSKLGLPEALTLSIIPQNPVKRTSKNSELKKIRNRLFARWLKQHPQDQEKQPLFGLPLVMQTNQNLPFLAPHFVNMVLKENPGLSQSISTTLDYRLQLIVERITRHYLARKKMFGVHNAAVLLVDSRTMSIKALMGSADFFNNKISGQINGVETKRSPGSTLKPFIYGLALDQGLIHPNTVLKDVPQSFNGYNPENFDYDFMGPIKAKDALVLSRNIPAIELSNQLTNPTLHKLLEQAHVTQLRSESYYGLSLNLGGVELTMKELVGLYAMLINDGVWYPINSLKGAPRQKGRRLLSTEASFLVFDMLKNTPMKESNNEGSSQLPIAWKTGTSSGYRDAWTVGVFGPYVLAVWIGNFDNQANPAFIGKEIAAPLFFELIDAIKHERGPIARVEKYPEHMHLEKIEVCKASGMLPGRYCTDTEWTWFIPGKSPIKTDTIFREVAINGKTGLRTCHIDENTRFEVYEFWPSDLLRIFRRAGIQRHTPPFFEPGCALSGNSGISPQITSPQAGVSYIVHANTQSNKIIPLTAVTDAGIAHLYWFINESFVAETKSDEPYLWQAKPGKYVVRVVDDRGLSDARDIIIQMVS
ncbi:TPA: penicillin-binding protein 1C [Legionella pneumophila subsp. pneumophila]|nr:penicillin-binding protein 1C [Legionella pneumophila subsp. pneumophila]HAT9170342.1 penicillin-binding protein 1C [Legionella pneumophila subsp. pneumophila]HAT9585232.1 penicillin-binding protein 1C [Legionella pneumophila subsp. pneumophila]HAT9720467.1 penicillin-binding protein 1C [Legionella pneumophila subsp. pneumophila]HAU1690690.1 penicillin-binding protein 1C [Legionella pneumophila]